MGRPKGERKARPMQNPDVAGLWSKISFGWVTPAVTRGHEGTLDQNDVSEMFSSHDKSQRLCEAFEQV